MNAARPRLKAPIGAFCLYGGEGGKNLTSKDIRRNPKVLYYLALRELTALG